MQMLPLVQELYLELWGQPEKVRWARDFFNYDFDRLQIKRITQSQQVKYKKDSNERCENY